MARQKGVKMNKPTKKELYEQVEFLEEQLKIANGTIAVLSNGKVVPDQTGTNSVPVSAQEETK